MSALLIVYNSKGGSTRRYAQLLASSTGGEAVSMKDVRPGQLREAGTVVFASWLMAGNLQGDSFLKRHWPILKDKRTALAVVGLGQRLDEKLWEEYTARAFTPEMRQGLRVFYLRGAYDPSKRGFFTRKLMNAVASALSKKPSPTPEEQALARDMRQGCDYVSADALAALEAYLH
ncbi:MAG: flavodoxin domain-containing protein [Aristaeellaceae bacterium]